MFVGVFGGSAGHFTNMKCLAFPSSCFFFFPVAQQEVLFRDSSHLWGEGFFPPLILV